MDFSFLNNDKILGGDEKQSAQEILEKKLVGARNLKKFINMLISEEKKIDKIPRRNPK